METVPKVLEVAVAVILTVVLISVGVYLTRQGQHMVSGSSEEISSFQWQMGNVEFAFYDGTEITGAELMEGYKELNDKILSDGVTRLRFEFYTLALNGGFSDTASLYVTDANYLNPDATFKCSLIYNAEHQTPDGVWVADDSLIVGIRAYQLAEQ